MRLAPQPSGDSANIFRTSGGAHNSRDPLGYFNSLPGANLSHEVISKIDIIKP